MTAPHNPASQANSVYQYNVNEVIPDLGICTTEKMDIFCQYVFFIVI